MASFETRLLTRLKQLLREVDLASTTERQLRKSLEAEFDRELSGYKGLIRSCVEEYLQGADEQEEAEAPGGKEEEEEPVTEVHPRPPSPPSPPQPPPRLLAQAVAGKKPSARRLQAPLPFSSLAAAVAPLPLLLPLAVALPFPVGVLSGQGVCHV